MAEYYEKEKVIEFIRSYRNSTDVAFHMEEHVNEVPAADVVPVRHGRWMHKYDALWSGGGKTKCSICNYGYADGAYHEVDEFSFCPNCGAKMDGK